MRISTWQQANTGLNNMLKQQQALDTTHQQISSGKKILTPADDPTGTSKLISLSMALSSESQYERNMGNAENRLMQSESLYGEMGNVLQRARELTLQANNATQTNESRQVISREIAQIRDVMLDLANTRDSQGEYIFSGLSTSTRAFAETATGVSFRGDQGARLVSIAPDQQIKISDSGFDVFQNIATSDGRFQLSAASGNTGNTLVSMSTQASAVTDTYTLNFIQASDSDPVTFEVSGAVSGLVASGAYQPGNDITFNGITLSVSASPANADSYSISPMQRSDIFSMLDTIANTLASPANDSASQANVQNTLGQSIDSLDRAMDHFFEFRADAGHRLARLETQLDINADAQLSLQTIASKIEDLDLTEALTRLNLQMTALQAAQQSYVKVQGLSLFNFL
ncbi:MAG: flagellar hook-associated protein FlgL [Gammaproteobacteria bacterium]|nr:flagellar hook-associated protein FlgL [Gammaproteobacteria bacterium]